MLKNWMKKGLALLATLALVMGLMGGALAEDAAFEQPVLNLSLIHI